MSVDWYSVFGLDRGASSDELARNLDEQLSGADPADAPRLDQLRAARDVLGDPQSRAAYDASLGASTAAGGGAVAVGGTSASLPWILGAVVAVLAVVLGGLVAVLALDIGTPDDARSTTSVETAAVGDTTDASGESPEQQGRPEAGTPPDGDATAPGPPVPGAFAGAGGPRPAGAEPLPTYVSRYGNLTSAHLLTPSGRIGCDFSEQNSISGQGLCAITSYNTPTSPLGCIDRSGTCKGRWVFPLSENRVDDPVDSSGTTGWMNQPANDGYTVPVAEYGTQYYFENWVCASEESGLTCWNTVTGSGVFLSAELTERFEVPVTGAASPSGDSGSGAVVLGSMPSNGRGYGTVRPKDVYNGGVARARVTDITWDDWGGDRAEGTGTGVWVPEGRDAGYAQDTPATIVAWDLGQCDGKTAYRKVTWYFPSKGQDIDSQAHMDACWTER